MAQNIQEERLRWVLPIITKEVKLSDAAKVCPYGKRSLERWVAAYKKGGAEALIPRSTEPKTHQRETPIWLKEQIIAIRKKKKTCALKIHWQLEKKGIHIHARTIGKILKKEKLVRKYRTRKIIYRYIRAERRPGELFELDVKYVPGRIAGKRYFQYTAIDTASRWRYLRVYEEQSSYHSVCFLREVLRRFPHPIQAIKTDNGIIFTNRYVGGNLKRSDRSFRHLHALDTFCAQHGIVHYLIDPGKPAQQGTVERSHREDQEKFYDTHTFASFSDLQKKIRRWNIYSNNLEHCGLGGKTPMEFLSEYQ
jgi:transposase InsO family protein